jgi:putative heme-binding domain-containing protein
MKRLNRRSCVGLLLACLLSCVIVWEASAAPEKTVLFIAGGPSHGSGEHEYDAGCRLLAKHINEYAPGITAHVFLGWPEDNDSLEQADAVVIFSDGGDGHPILDRLDYIDTLMNKGVGLMGIHYAVEVPKGAPGNYFQDWLGGYYETHWSVNPHWEADVTLNENHPITRGVQPFSLHDEWYFNMRWRNDDESTVTSILKAAPDDTARSGESTWPPGPKDHIVDASGREETLLWAKERDDGGRGVGFTGAHFHRNWQNDDYRKLVLNAIAWIAKGEIPQDGVTSPTPSDAEMHDRIKPPLEDEEEGEEEEFNREGRLLEIDIDPSDDAILFASDVVSADTPGHAVNVDVEVEGLHTIFLVVTDAGDGVQCDFANWAEPHFSGPTREIKLTDLEWETAAMSHGEIGIGQNAEGGRLIIDGEPVAYGLGAHATSVIAYDVPRGMTRFKALCGLDSQGTNEGCGSTVQFMVLSEAPEMETTDSPQWESDESRTALSLVDEAPRTLPGFQADVVYRVPADAGSWVSLTTDDKGRLLASGQYGGLFRITLRDEGSDPEVERLNVDIGGCQGLLYAFDSLYAVVNGGRQSGLYRLQDTNGDDSYDEVNLLRSFSGNGEHGPHGVILSPDGENLYVIGGNGTASPNPEQSRAPFNWGGDRLLPDLGGNPGELQKDWPGGWVCKVDPEGKTFELICSGFRNAYDIAFNEDGELFTYDSDMEWDMGMPWYRPTRVNHITSGAEFGWRSGTGKWPDYYLDSLGSVVDVGAGSPTGVTFGYGAKVPAKYQRAFYILDWSYGKIYAMHLTPDGASYTGELETFVTGAPMPVCDMIVHPFDNSMYFVTGGRATSSAIYRVTYVGDESTDEVSGEDTHFADARRQRRTLEAYHGGEHADAVDDAWPFLGDADRRLRFAARIAIENQPVSQWRDRALAETNPRSLIAAMVAQARTDESYYAQGAIVARLNTIEWGSLGSLDRLDLLRAYALACTRFGDPSESLRDTLLARLNSAFPAESHMVNRELARLLTYLDAPGIGDRMVRVMKQEPTQEEQIFYAMLLRNLDEDQWSVADHQYYFQWLNSSTNVGGGVSLPDLLAGIKMDALDVVSDTRMAKLKDALQTQPAPDPYAQFQGRDFVQQWTMDDLLPVTAQEMDNRDLESGRRSFAEAMCLKCHRFNQTGGVTGPNLTGVGKRYDIHTLIQSIIDPSAVISDQYDTYAVTMKDGQTHTGRIGDINTETVYLMVDLFNPADMMYVPHDNMEEIRRVQLSMMPEGLVDSFTRDDILDMIAYMQSANE